MARKTNPNEKFKKLILTWWVWAIIAIVSYFIFASIPIQWTGNGLEEVAGTGGLKTFFAYFTQIAWIVAVSLLIFSGIKVIQKSKIEDYWKVPLTILGIIGIIAYVIFSLSSMGMFNKLFYEHDERIGDFNNEDVIKIHINLLEKEGYEVLYFGYLDIPTHSAYIKMKSLGKRNEQINSALISLSLVYPDAPGYTIKILEEKQECNYIILGDSYRALYGDSGNRVEYEFNEEGELVVTEEILKSNELYQVLQNQIDNPICS